MGSSLGEESGAKDKIEGKVTTTGPDRSVRPASVGSNVSQVPDLDFG